MKLADGYVPEALFGADHFSTLAYAETVMVDSAGFQVGADPRMRAGRQHFRVMQQQCQNPKRAHNSDARNCVVMEKKNSTVLKDNTVVDGHDDYHCLQDMAAAGYFTLEVEDVEPGAVLKLSDRGREVANVLRAHKADGGRFADFTAPNIPEDTPAPGA
jgi:hypothetical protein